MPCQVDGVLQLKGLNQVGIPDQAVVRNADILELLHHLDEHSRESALRSPAPEVGRSLHGISRQPWHPPRKACPTKQCVHRPVIVITLREVHVSKGPTRFLYGPHGKRLHGNLEDLHEGSFTKDNVGIVQFSTSLSGKSM